MPERACGVACPTRAGLQLGSVPVVPRTACWQPDSHVPGRVQRERWPDGRAGRRYIAATLPFRKELEENGVYGARVEQDASYVRVLPSIDIATKSGRDWILQKFVREILCDTVMHLVVATPPLPETTGAEFLQILVAQSQVYTEICVCVCVCCEITHHRGYDLLRASACICCEITYHRGIGVYML